jgi:2-dehydro-3-deoxy-D-arabinonate dehydratase
MRYYRLDGTAGVRLIVEDNEHLYDLTSVKSSLNDFDDLCEAAFVAARSIDDVSLGLLESAERLSSEELADAIRPVVAQEVWAAGVTYQISEQAREAESGMPEVYLDVYEDDRPEVFFKATPSRTVGPNESVGIRKDSSWDVPEPELGVVLYRGNIVGYTIGNDVSSRSIEGANPLYLPQAKVYDRCCAIGPAVTTAASLDASDLEMSMQILRDGEQLYADRTSTAELHRTIDELVSYTIQSDAVPELMVLLTGTSLVPEEGFTLRPGDTVRITIEGIGTLENGVIEV